MAEQTTLPPEIAAQDKGPGINASIISVTAVGTVFMLARLFVRVYIVRRPGIDDFFVIAAVTCSWLSVGFSVAAVASSMGRHIQTLTMEQLSGAILWTMVGFLPGVLSFAVPKFAVVGLLCRILNPSRRHRIFLWCVSTLSCLSLIGCIIILFAQCTPSRSQWDFSVKRTCWDHRIIVHYSMYASTLSVLVDLYLAIYPATVLAKLQMPLRRKLILSGALGIGSVASVVAVYKMTRLPGLASADFSYDASDLVIWTVVEGSALIIASCIPVLQPLVDILSGKATLSGTRRRRSGYRMHEDSGGNKQSDVELSEDSRDRQRRRGKHPVLDATIDTVNHEADTILTSIRAKESQEEILKQGQGQGEGERASYDGPGIVKTHVYEVSYSEDEASREQARLAKLGLPNATHADWIRPSKV